MSENESTSTTSVWVIDDSRAVCSLLSGMLEEAGCSVTAFNNPEVALERLCLGAPNVILCDILMPEMSGTAFLERVFEVDRELPVILITSHPRMDFALEAIRYHVFDFIIKPVKKEVLLLAVRRAVEFRELLMEERACLRMMEDAFHRNTTRLKGMYKDLRNSTLETIFLLSKAAEFRDCETANHNMRIGLYCNVLAERMGLSPRFCDDLLYASPMHDIGKIGIADSILLKEAPLTEQEYSEMKRHTHIGAQILQEGKAPMLRMAREIALYHHERWDGSGYPFGLQGKDIPLAARLVMMADQYDALRSNRPYKDCLDHETAFTVLTTGDSRTSPRHFDPQVMDAFLSIHDVFKEIFSGHYKIQQPQAQVLTEDGEPFYNHP